MNQLGQLLISGISSKRLIPTEKQFIKDSNLGGVILFGHNYDSAGQLAELINEIQSLRGDYPLFIAVDHEGGRVQRFKSGFTKFPPMQDLAKLNSAKLCYEAHQVMAVELKACGVNLNFSPCCDILSNLENTVIGDRSFGSTHEIVSSFATAAIRGLQTNNILACAKHFPGHGSTLEDSHFDLPYLKKSLEELEDSDIIPFLKAAKAKVEFIMMGHLVLKEFDEQLPCSLSKKAHDYLRTKLKFNKLIISDDMNMHAITDQFSLEKAAVMALNAGSDIIEYRDMESAQKGYEAIVQAKQLGQLTNSSINKKVERVIDCKKRYLNDFAPKMISKLSSEMKINEHQQFIEKILDKINQ
ncbi:MAG: beta-N-acetylhexosaminidase [Bdellovibrionales bacterium]|jgi:beta-N-acetylhexosaminidase|nr:beta-N-acetylhexosaminidase [Bdellovibrionales bacterium]